MVLSKIFDSLAFAVSYQTTSGAWLHASVNASAGARAASMSCEPWVRVPCGPCLVPPHGSTSVYSLYTGSYSFSQTAEDVSPHTSICQEIRSQYYYLIVDDLISSHFNHFESHSHLNPLFSFMIVSPAVQCVTESKIQSEMTISVPGTSTCTISVPGTSTCTTGTCTTSVSARRNLAQSHFDAAW